MFSAARTECELKDLLYFSRNYDVRQGKNSIIEGMIRMISDIVGSNVILFQEKAKAGEVKELIIDCKDGAFLGLTVFDPIKRKDQVIPSSEITGTGKGFIMARDYNSLSEYDDVVKIKESLLNNPKIIGAKVETESGQKLGKVTDATIDFRLLSLERLFVASSSLVSFLSSDLIIPAKKIIEIKKNKIIVSDKYLKVPSKKVAKLALPALD